MGDTMRGIGRVGPDRELDWSTAPPALVALRRGELRAQRRAAVAKAVGSVGLLAACVAMSAIVVLGHISAIGITGLLAVWGLRGLIPSLHDVRSTTHQLAELRLPALPEARIVTR